MDFVDMLKMRRSVYKLNNQLPVSKNEVIKTIKDVIKYVPDAFNMKSQRVLLLLGEQHEKFWNNVYDILVAVSGKNLSHDKTDSFAAGFGTILYFYDKNIVDEYKKQFVLYANYFDNWAIQSNAMLQFAIWTALASVGIGASLQHYNPIIDDMVYKMFNIPNNWILNAQMPFGGIIEKPEPKAQEDVAQRIKIVK